MRNKTAATVTYPSAVSRVTAETCASLVLPFLSSGRSTGSVGVPVELLQGSRAAPGTRFVGQ